MKYLLLLALTTTVIAASLTGCSHDIYRAQYKYKPLPQPDVVAPTPSPNAATVPPTE